MAWLSFIDYYILYYYNLTITCFMDKLAMAKVIKEFIEQWKSNKEIKEITWVSDWYISSARHWYVSDDWRVRRTKESPLLKSSQEIEQETQDEIENKRVLVIWDLHEPYCKDWYLEFCKETYDELKCDTVIFIGDIADFESLSYHEKNTTCESPEQEVIKVRRALQRRYNTFPNAYVMLGNHDILPSRKAKTAWIPQSLLKTRNDIFEVWNGWKFRKEIIIDWVLYRHWDSGTAYKRCILEWMSVVQWHLHTEAGIQFIKNRTTTIFWMQVGTWIDRDNPTFQYAESLPKLQFLSCWVVLSWQLPIIFPRTT